MSESTAEQPIGEIVELTRELLVKIVDGYGPKGFIFPKYVITNHEYPLKTHDGPDIIIRKNSSGLTIPLAGEEGIYEVGNGSRYKLSDNLVFVNDKVYFNSLDPKNQLLYYIPFDQSTNVDRFTRKQLKKLEEKFNRYLLKRKSRLISNTNTLPGTYRQSDNTGIRKKVTVIRPLTASRYASSEPTGGRKTRRSKKSNKRKIYKRKTNKRKISKKKSRKSKK